MVKIDTKADFSMIKVSKEEVAEKMSASLKSVLADKKNEAPGNIILILPQTEKLNLSERTINEIKSAQDDSLKDDLSFIITPISNQALNEKLKEKEINFTPTLPEAIDMIMMEKLERDILGTNKKEDV